ncbi:hypothetical protein E2562_004952 [Oryza meyeriana var. granulata]|uniref:Uncharacterized protein n=1 Tax=Oryza meyeriana var. granulata TaxID=110450 RepID=A0A6G1C471_9ORYZ|nr:hypothetical protein E2562_004952 [Oryza meyeriana var. granulata]
MRSMVVAVAGGHGSYRAWWIGGGHLCGRRVGLEFRCFSYARKVFDGMAQGPMLAPALLDGWIFTFQKSELWSITLGKKKRTLQCKSKSQFTGAR